MKLKQIIFTLPLLLVLNSCNSDESESCTESVWYEDSDGDGLGNPDSSQSSCEQPDNYVANADDNDDSVFCIESVWYEDSDGDGLGNPDSFQSSCEQPDNYVANADDNDDSVANLQDFTIWEGEMITFTKEDNADWTLEENQDRITDNVWITRQNQGVLLNFAIETSDSDGETCQGTQPTDTEWAYGSTDDIPSLTFESLGELSECLFKQIVDGQNIVLHLITDDIYINLKFTSWSSGGSGGFSYERSTMN